VFDEFTEDEVTADFEQLLGRGIVWRDLAPRQHIGWQDAIEARAVERGIDVRILAAAPRGYLPWIAAMLPTDDWDFDADDLLEMIVRLGFVADDGGPDITAYMHWYESG
jgi:hypothetical protein